MTDLARLRVCFLAGTLGQGGSERQLYYALSALRSARARVRLLCLTEGEFWEAPIRALGVPVTHVGRFASRAVRTAAIARAVAAEPTDVLVSQHFYTNAYASVAGALLGIPDVGAVRSDAVSEVDANGALAGRFALLAPRLLAVNSRAAARAAERMGAAPGRIHFLGNAVDTAEYRPADAAPHPALELLAVGRLVPVKRFDALLDVLVALGKLGAGPFRATIVGSGPEGDALRRKASELGLGPDVLRFLDMVPSAADLYREADVLLLTSAWEGTPNVVLEAMASGLPVVATRAGGVVDLVEDGETGLLTSVDPPERMARAIQTLAEDAPRRRALGASGRRRVLEHHSLERLPARLADLFGAALS